MLTSCLQRKFSVSFIAILFFLLTLPFGSFSQTNLDSLLSIYQDHSKTDSVRLTALNDYARSGYLFSQPDSAKYFFELLFKEADSLNLPTFKVLGLSGQGIGYKVKNEFKKAKKYLEEALVIAKEVQDERILGEIYNVFGLIYRAENDFINSVKYHTLSLKSHDAASETRENISGKAQSLGNLGVVYSMQGDTSNARVYFFESLEMSKSISDVSGIGTQLSNIGLIYFNIGEYKKAMPYYQEAYSMHLKAGNLQNAAITLSNIGNLHGASGGFDEALEVFKEGRKISEQIGDTEMISHFISSIGSVYFSKEDYSLALKYKKEAKGIIENVGMFEGVEAISRDLHEVYKAMGNYENALKEFEYSIIIRDSMRREENQRASLRQEYEYNYEKQALADSLQFAQKEAITNLELARSQATLSQQRLGLIATILGLLLVASLAYFFYQSKKRQEIEANRIRELDAFKSTFYTNITHEFRTPLTVILGMVQQIEEQPEKYLGEGVQLIKRNGKNLLGQINQILNLSKLETNSMQLNIIQGDIIEFLRYSTEAFQSFANGQNISLRFFSPVEKMLMDYDPNSLQNIMSNLISNAMKYTDDGGDVKVVLEKADEQLFIKVQDTGHGIAAKELPHIFDRFYQVKNTKDQNVYGSGVGLAYVQELVKVLGGTIVVESKVGKGSTFLVKLPIRNEAELLENNNSKTVTLNWKSNQSKIDKIGNNILSPVTDKKPEILNSKLPQLLLIEDNADVVIYLKSCLEDLYQIEVAYNGRIGIEKALENIPDLIISDVMMPEKDGFEVCDTLKNDERTSHIPLILLTAKADVASKLAGLKRGADAYLSKPFDKEELLVRLEMLVERQKRMVSYFSKNNQEDLETNGVTEIIQIEDVFIKKVNKILEENIDDENFGLPQLCQKVRMSRSQLFRKMKALTDVPPSIYIKLHRLNKAKQLLENTDTNVAEAAYEVGFKDPSYFSKIFQETFGYSPSTIKNK